MNRPNLATTPAANGQQPTTPPQTNLANAGGVANGRARRQAAKATAVITLVAWVLLFGSAFGNFYLFWSYLDVRQKYRSLVRKTAQGGRQSIFGGVGPLSRATNASLSYLLLAPPGGRLPSR